MGGFALLTSTGFFFGATAALNQGIPWLMNVLLWVVFVIWQFGPVLFEGYSPGLSFREVARYPIRFPVYSFLNCLYGLSDPVAITCVVWLFAMWLAIMMQKPAWAPLAAVLFLIFIVLNVLCNRVIIGLLERFQSTRRGREMMIVIFLILMLIPQLFQFVGRDLERAGKLGRLKPILTALLPVNRVSPPGATFETLTLSASEKLMPLAILLAYTAIALLLFLRQSRKVYQGEIYAEGYAARRELKVDPGWSLPGIDLTISAIVEKEMRYLRQNLRMLVALAYPAIILIFIVFGRGGARQMFPLAHSASGVLCGFGAIMLLGVPNMAYNIFGFDNEGFGRWLLAPLPLRKVIFGKNLAHASIFAGMYLLVGMIVCAALKVAWVSVITITIAFFAILVLQFAVGNVCSAQWPKKVELTRMNSRFVSTAGVYTSLLVSLVIGVICALVMAASKFLELDALPLLASVIGAAIALLVYHLLLNRTVHHVYEHLENIERILSSLTTTA
ncbi:MAG: hypothetical protein DMG65_26750 [Candidatus Angelobacter sp. Gp1-AA117]|nr:MAG: hypothetical protein DMG65_26750 [Candidatus Angelobacter sp. Gp1-AA117]